MPPDVVSERIIVSPLQTDDEPEIAETTSEEGAIFLTA